MLSPTLWIQPAVRFRVKLGRRSVVSFSAECQRMALEGLRHPKAAMYREGRRWKRRKDELIKEGAEHTALGC